MFCLRFFKAETRQRRRSRFESCVLFVLSYDDDARYIFTPISRATQFSDLKATQILRFSDWRYQRAGAWELLRRVSAVYLGCLFLILSFLFSQFHSKYRESRVTVEDMTKYPMGLITMNTNHR